jgi:hypothetical protein
MRITQEFVELRDAGKWIAIAKKWIAENGPCSKSEYFSAVRPLMPTHIRDTHSGKKEKKRSQIALCKMALSRFGIKGDIVELKTKPIKPVSDRGLIRNRIKEVGYVDSKFLSSVPRGTGVARQLWELGEIMKIGRALYCDPSRVDEFQKLFGKAETR